MGEAATTGTPRSSASRSSLDVQRDLAEQRGDAMVDELVTHPHVVLSQMSSADATGVEELLAASRTFDVMAGWVATCAGSAVGGTR